MRAAGIMRESCLRVLSVTGTCDEDAIAASSSSACFSACHNETKISVLIQTAGEPHPLGNNAPLLPQQGQRGRRLSCRGRVRGLLATKKAEPGTRAGFRRVMSNSIKSTDCSNNTHVREHQETLIMGIEGNKATIVKARHATPKKDKVISSASSATCVEEAECYACRFLVVLARCF
ncbi:hypothetical protein E2C01_014713 [Portunus trituberculatus]|uniref:Uncharacterized protein n=1 Tax=Portunus trituberculatus TaxID=210409 RepID=A0A5B7DKY0_PORTR|nr:hypothetical protein [Portunus trituberculatus]